MKSQRHALFCFGSVSFAYFAYAGLFSTYAPLWFSSLGFGTLAIGSMASLQSGTRLFSPYVWGWLADHSHNRIRLLRVAVALSLLSSLGFLVSTNATWVTCVTVALFMCTAAVIPISEAALANLVSPDGPLDTRRYGRVRVWGSVGFVISVMASGFALQAVGVAWFPGPGGGFAGALDGRGAAACPPCRNRPTVRPVRSVRCRCCASRWWPGSSPGCS